MEGKSKLSTINQFIKLVKSLTGTAVLSIIAGALGRLCAIAVPVVSARWVALTATNFNNPAVRPSVKVLFVILMVLGVCRSIFRYLNKYIIATNDKIEFNTTISSATTVLTSIVMTIFICCLYPIAGIVAAIAYVAVCGMIPLYTGISSNKAALSYKKALNKMHGFINSIVQGIDEIIQFKNGKNTVGEIVKYSDDLADATAEFAEYKRNQRGLTMICTYAFAVIVFLVMFNAHVRDKVTFVEMIVATVAMRFSFEK